MRKLLIIIILCTTAIAAKAPNVAYKPRVKPTIDNPVMWLDAIIRVESSGGTYNSNEPNAVGILQQYPIFVDDVNRILGKKKYSYDDRNDKRKAIEMFFIYQKYYNPEMNFERMCKIQCSGPDGMKESNSDNYYRLVRDKLYSKVYAKN